MQTRIQDIDMDSISKSRLQWRWQEPADQASDQTLPLHLDNLELRFETIDKDALQSEKAKKTYEDIAAAFARRRAPPGRAVATRCAGTTPSVSKAESVAFCVVIVCDRKSLAVCGGRFRTMWRKQLHCRIPM